MYWTLEVHKRLDFLLQVLVELELPFSLRVSGYMAKLRFLDWPHPELFRITMLRSGFLFAVEYGIENSDARRAVENRFLKQFGVHRNLNSLLLRKDDQTVLQTWDGFSQGQTRFLATEEVVRRYREMSLIRSYRPAERGL